MKSLLLVGVKCTYERTPRRYSRIKETGGGQIWLEWVKGNAKPLHVLQKREPPTYEKLGSHGRTARVKRYTSAPTWARRSQLQCYVAAIKLNKQARCKIQPAESVDNHGATTTDGEDFRMEAFTHTHTQRWECAAHSKCDLFQSTSSPCTLHCHLVRRQVTRLQDATVAWRSWRMVKHAHAGEQESVSWLFGWIPFSLPVPVDLTKWFVSLQTLYRPKVHSTLQCHAMRREKRELSTKTPSIFRQPSEVNFFLQRAPQMGPRDRTRHATSFRASALSRPGIQNESLAST